MEALYRYPRGIAGFALLLLRIAIGVLLLANGCSDILTMNPSRGSLIHFVVCLGFCLGLFTSFLGIAAAILSLWALLWGHTNLALVQVATLLLSGAIAILGPGGHSLDALLFGRRRVVH